MRPAAEASAPPDTAARERGAGGTLDPGIRVDFTRASVLTPDVETAIEQCFDYQPWDARQIERGQAVRSALAHAVKIVVANVPPGPDRSAAIRKLREARMDANSAITFAGRY